MLVGLDVVPLRDDVRLVAAIAAALVDQAKAAIDRAIGGALQPDVDAGLHGEAALVQRLRAVFLFEMLADFFGEERRHRSHRLRLPARDDRLLLGRVGLLLRDVAVLGHLLQRVVAPELRRGAIDVRALPRRRLDDAGDHRRLFERHVLRALAEIQARRGFDAVGAVAEVGLVGSRR